MRVISGIARGKRLKAPSGMNTRPITDMIKEALFNVIGSDIIETSFLDLFAGSGSVGIEALSRQASKVIMVDNSFEAIKIIKANIDNCGFIDGFEIHRNDVFKAIDLLHRKGARFDYIYVDPPFTCESIFPRVMQALDKADILAEKGLIIIRTPRKLVLKNGLNRIIRYRINEYGESVLNYYSLKEDTCK